MSGARAQSDTQWRLNTSQDLPLDRRRLRLRGSAPTSPQTRSGCSLVAAQTGLFVRILSRSLSLDYEPTVAVNTMSSFVVSEPIRSVGLHWKLESFLLHKPIGGHVLNSLLCVRFQSQKTLNVRQRADVPPNKDQNTDLTKMKGISRLI